MSISAQSAVSVLIIGLASEDCHVVLRTPHNDKEYVMQRKPFKADEGIPARQCGKKQCHRSFSASLNVKRSSISYLPLASKGIRGVNIYPYNKKNL